MDVHTVERAFSVPYDKQAKYIALGERMIVRLGGEHHRLSLVDAAAFAGKSMSMSLAVPPIRLFVNRLLFTLHGKTAHRWERGDMQVMIAGRARHGLLSVEKMQAAELVAELTSAMGLVTAGKLYPIQPEQHAACILAWYNDTTLVTNG
jgi:hypothetical protein